VRASFTLQPLHRCDGKFQCTDGPKTRLGRDDRNIPKLIPGIEPGKCCVQWQSLHCHDVIVLLTESVSWVAQLRGLYIQLRHLERKYFMIL